MKAAWVHGLALLVLAGWVGAQEADLKKAFKEIEGIKKTTRKLSKESRDKIEKAIEGKLSDAEANAVIWEARAKVPEANAGEPVRIFYMTTTVKGAQGDVKIGVAVAPEERVVAGLLVLENKDDPALASPDFLEQFGRFVYGANLSSPASTLANQRKRGAERKDDDAKKLDGLFKLEDLMHPVGAAWSKLHAGLDKDDAAAADACDELSKLLGEAKKTVSDLSFLKTSQADSFRRRLDDSVRAFGEVAGLVKAKKFAEARAKANEAEKESCSRCHAGTQRSFREQRNTLDIGNGYFAVGHDIYAPSGPKETYTAVALAVRRCVLILSEAK